MAIPHPTHVENMRLNFEEVRRLIGFHVSSINILGRGPGRKSGAVLNKSAIVLVVACWEAFIEDLLSASFDFMLQRATTHNIFPNSVLTAASKNLREAADERMVWELAGTGWQTILKNHKVKTLSKYLDAFNTPRAENIDNLFSKLIGLNQLSACWSWKGIANEEAKKKLSDLITLRGSIAHRVAASKTVRNKDVTDYMGLVGRLAVKTSNRTRQHIHDRTGQWPWLSYRHGQTS